MAGNGEALALFPHQAGATAPFQVQAARFDGSSWGAPQPRQPAGSPEGRFAVTEPFYFGNGDLLNLRVWWRETDPANGARMRILCSDLQFLER